MRGYAKYLAGAAALAVIAAGAWFLLAQQKDRRALSELVKKTRDSLVFVEGGSFQKGNYRSSYRAADGTVEEGWADDYTGRPRTDVTLDSFYISAFETSYADFNLYLAAQGYPVLKADAEYRRYLPDRAAEMSFEEAVKYCDWLGREAGLTMRLPSEAEWEYAARSRGQIPLWPTDDGNFERGRNLAASGFDLSADEEDPPIGTFPPNPLGLYNLADGLYEWVGDSEAGDPEGAAIFKGGSNTSSVFYERIPGRGVVERETQESLDTLLSMLSEETQARIRRHDDPLAPGSAGTTARCVAVETRPPEKSGFGQTPTPATLSPPFSGQE